MHAVLNLAGHVTIAEKGDGGDAVGGGNQQAKSAEFSYTKNIRPFGSLDRVFDMQGNVLFATYIHPPRPLLRQVKAKLGERDLYDLLQTSSTICVIEEVLEVD